MPATGRVNEVERLARVSHAAAAKFLGSPGTWEDRPEKYRQAERESIRAVLASLFEGSGGRADSSAGIEEITGGGA